MPRAPRQCPKPGCDALIVNRKYCEAHTVAWAGPRTTSSTITSSAAWRTLRRFVLDRDEHRCQIRTPDICLGDATTVDHIIATAAGGPALNPGNCQAACAPCNDDKARRESATARHH